MVTAALRTGKKKVSLHRLEFVPARYAKERPAIRNTGLNIVELNTGEGTMAKKRRHGDEQTHVDRGEPRSPRSPGGSRMKTRSQDELFPREELCMNWTKMRRVGAGFANLGNTCFMNSVLQCLVHTPALAELLLSRRKLTQKPAAHGELDPIGMTQRLVEDSLEGKRDVVSPVQHAKSLKRINRGFRLGRQEDAHEYLIALLDAMHDQSIAGMNPKPSRELEYTSFIYQIFGGKIRSQLKCTQCDYESNTYDPFLDLSLEISRAQSVKKALQRFTAGEVLDGQNSYKCPKQNKMVKAVKRMTVEDAPSTLIIQLKRFEFSRSGRKISKHVEFEETIDLAPFMSHTQPKASAVYDLYGILVHDGFSMHSGHYYSFLRNVGGEWHKFDDSRVGPTSARNAMGQQPYILFYVKRSAVAPAGKQNRVPAALKPDTQARKDKKVMLPSTPGPAPGIKRKKDIEKVHQPAEKATASTVAAKPSSKKAMEAKSIASKKKLFSPSKRALSRTMISPGASLTPIARSKAQRGYNLLPKTYSMRNSQDSTKKRRKKKDSVDDLSTKKQKTLESGDGMDIDGVAIATKPPKPALKKSNVSRRGVDAINASGKTRNRASMGLDTWDTIDKETRMKRDVNMRKSGPSKGNKPDAYDVEYDKGRVKKTKRKGQERGSNNSKLFDAFQKSIIKGKQLAKGVVGAVAGGKRR